jgi:hypothetical protein
MSLSTNEFARRDHSAAEIRREPMRAHWNFTALATNDAHTIDVHFSCSIAAADTSADRKLFTETFLTGADVVTIDTITAHFARTIKSTFAQLASQCKAADVIGGPATWITTITTALKSPAFSAGLEILPPFHLEIESPTLQQRNSQEIARQRAADLSAAHLEQLHRAGDLLKQFDSMRATNPGLSAGKIIEKFSATDRGPMLQSLLLASSNAATPSQLWAVAGAQLLKINPHIHPPTMEMIDLPTKFGPLRSVKITGKHFLIGAQTGILRAPLENPLGAQFFACPNLNSQLGFNSVAGTSERLFATHSEAGIVAWNLFEPSVDPVIYGEVVARNLRTLDESRILYSAADVLILRKNESRMILPAQSQSQIVTILPLAQTIVIVYQDGTLTLLDRATCEVIDVRHRPSRISAAATMPWLGDVRLLLASDDGPIDCVGLEDSLTSEYLSPYRGLKQLSAADLIAAISPDRQRIILWNSWDGQRPIGEIHITSKTKHRVADIAFD